MIYLLGYQEAKAREGEFALSISINDHNKDPSFRVYGTIATLELNFNDCWLNERGEHTIWAGDSALVVDPATPLSDKTILDKVDKFKEEHPTLLHQNLLIHCWAGVSRSSSVLLYLLMKEGMDFDQALKSILEVRPFARPNLLILEEMETRFGKTDFVSKAKSLLDYNKIRVM